MRHAPDARDDDDNVTIIDGNIGRRDLPGTVG
jgi:hypothetical protein